MHIFRIQCYIEYGINMVTKTLHLCWVFWIIPYRFRVFLILISYSIHMRITSVQHKSYFVVSRTGVVPSIGYSNNTAPLVT